MICLPGEDSARADMYSEAVHRGGYVLTLTAADDEQVERASDILDRHDPINMEERAAEWKSSGWTAGAGGAISGSDMGSDTRTSLDTGTVGSTPPMAAQPGAATAGSPPQMGAEQAGMQNRNANRNADRRRYRTSHSGGRRAIAGRQAYGAARRRAGGAAGH